MPQLSSFSARRPAFALISALALGALMPSITSAQQPPAGAATLPAATPAPAAVSSSPSVAKNGRVFEMRTYYCHPGRLEALNKRFRDHTNRLFAKHGIELVGYWMPIDKPDILTYVLAYPSREAAVKSWTGFRGDAEWNTARTASEADGPIVQKVESVYMSPTDYSPIK
ncbi:MAG: NIPSNAP family protein [Vicinamibacteraceae bacterium]